MSDFRARYASSPASVPRARRALINFARTAGFEGDELTDLLIAVGEALANAVEHGHAEGSEFSVSAQVKGGAVIIEIQDGGRGFDAGTSANEAPKPVAGTLRGYGTSIMRALVDNLEYKNCGTCVRLVKRISIARAPSLEAES